MIHELKDTPNTMVGFEATHDLSKEDFDKVVLPAVDELVKRTDKLNYLFVLEPSIKSSTIGMWMTDAMLGLNHIDKWNRAAIVTDAEVLTSLTDQFGKEVPGEFRGFTSDSLLDAIHWVGEQDGLFQKQVFQEEGDTKE